MATYVQLTPKPDGTSYRQAYARNRGIEACWDDTEIFAILDAEDSRFWVMRIPKLQSGYDPDFKQKLRDEIPFFIGFLKHRWGVRGSSSERGLVKMATPNNKPQ